MLASIAKEKPRGRKRSERHRPREHPTNTEWRSTIRHCVSINRTCQRYAPTHHTRQIRRGGGGDGREGETTGATIDWIRGAGRVQRGGESPTPRASADFYVLSRALKQLSRNYLRNGSRCLWKRYKYVSSNARVLVSLHFPSNAIIAIDCLAVDNYRQLFSVYYIWL